MKYQCTVCGQIINQNDVCPICGSDGDKIIALGDEEDSTTYRCLSCGRVFENKDVCPFCGGEELYDLTHDKMFNRNDVKKEESKVDAEEDSIDLFSSNFEDEEKFEDKPVDISKVEIKEEKKEENNKKDEVEEDESSIISDDEYDNSDIIVHESERVEEEEANNSEENSESLLDENLMSLDSDLASEEAKDENSVNEEPLLDENDAELANPFDDLPFEKEVGEVKDEGIGDLEEEVQEIEEEEINFEDDTKEVKEEEIHGEIPLNVEENNSPTIEKEIDNEELTSLKEKRQEINDQILLSSILKIKDSLNFDSLSYNDSLILKDCLTQKDDLDSLNNSDLVQLFKEKYELDKKIFDLEKTPLNGYLLYKDETILKKLKDE